MGKESSGWAGRNHRASPFWCRRPAIGGRGNNTRDSRRASYSPSLRAALSACLPAAAWRSLRQANGRPAQARGFLPTFPRTVRGMNGKRPVVGRASARIHDGFAFSTAPPGAKPASQGFAHRSFPGRRASMGRRGVRGRLRRGTLAGRLPPPPASGAAGADGVIRWPPSLAPLPRAPCGRGLEQTRRGS